MSTIKERLFGAITVMSDSDAEKIWNVILDQYSDRSWNSIETVTPDEWDQKILCEIVGNPECHEFITSEEAMKELGL